MTESEPEHPAVEVGGEGTNWLTPGVRGIGLASLLADIGHEVPTALLPSLLTSTLGAPAAALGLIEGIADASAGIARFGGGALADDDPERRRAAAVGGYTATAVLLTRGNSARGVAVAKDVCDALRTQRSREIGLSNYFCARRRDRA